MWDSIFHPGVEKVQLALIQEGFRIDGLWDFGEHPIEHQQSIGNKELLERFQLLLQYCGKCEAADGIKHRSKGILTKIPFYH